jgi:hypothetical protein
MIKRAIGAVLIAVIFGTSAHAQTTVHTLWSGHFDNAYRFLSVDPDARSILGDRPWATGGSISDLYITPDGALMVGRGLGVSSFLTLRNLATDAVSSLPLPFVPTFFFGNPERPEIYIDDSAGIVALSASGFRRLSSRKCQFPSFSHSSMSADGRRLAIGCAAGDVFRGAVLDTASGAEVATFTGVSEYGGLTLSRDGQEFYTLTPAPNNLGTVLRRYSASTETVLAEVALPYARRPDDDVQVDPRTGRLYVAFGDGSFSHILRAYDPISLLELRSLGSFRGLSRLAFDPHRPRAYRALYERIPAEPTDFSVPHFSIIDTDALEVVLTARLNNSFSEFNQFALPAVVVAPLPAAPTGLVVTVQGTSVQLSWTPGPPPGTALRFVLEAGSGPGLANLTTFDVGPQKSFVVVAVPSGTYYVRVRPANVTGSGRPSNEIVVTVP